jgi:hypothetical protein
VGADFQVLLIRPVVKYDQLYLFAKIASDGQIVRQFIEDSFELTNG